MKQPHLDTDVKRVDSVGRLNLGKELANEHYVMTKDDHGQITLTPVAIIPKRELWLWQNPEALASVERGIRQAKEGDVHDLGDFAKYANDDED